MIDKWAVCFSSQARVIIITDVFNDEAVFVGITVKRENHTQIQ